MKPDSNQPDTRRAPGLAEGSTSAASGWKEDRPMTLRKLDDRELLITALTVAAQMLALANALLQHLG